MLRGQLNSSRVPFRLLASQLGFTLRGGISARMSAVGRQLTHSAEAWKLLHGVVSDSLN